MIKAALGLSHASGDATELVRDWATAVPSACSLSRQVGAADVQDFWTAGSSPAGAVARGWPGTWEVCVRPGVGREETTTCNIVAPCHCWFGWFNTARPGRLAIGIPASWIIAQRLDDSESEKQSSDPFSDSCCIHREPRLCLMKLQDR